VTDDGAAWADEHLALTRELIETDGPLTTAEVRARLPALDARVTRGKGAYQADVAIASQVIVALGASGAIVRGENDGGWKTSRPRWTVAADWIPVEPALPEAEGYAELVRSWLHTFGPGTEADIVWWLGATKAAARRALADVGAVEVGLDHGTGWVLPDDLDDEPPVAPWAALLPALDPTTMGWKGRDFYLGEHAARLFDANGNGGPTAWWDGRIVGGWSQDDAGRVVVVPAEPLARDARTALDGKAAELTAWLDGDVVKSIYQSPLVRG